MFLSASFSLSLSSFYLSFLFYFCLSVCLSLSLSLSLSLFLSFSLSFSLSLSLSLSVSSLFPSPLLVDATSNCKTCNNVELLLERISCGIGYADSISSRCLANGAAACAAAAFFVWHRSASAPGPNGAKRRCCGARIITVCNNVFVEVC